MFQSLSQLKFLKTALMVVVSVGFLAACSTTDEEGIDRQSQIELERIERERGEQVPVADVYGENLDTGTYAQGSGTQDELVSTIGDRVYFGYDRYDLDAEARNTLERQAQWLSQYPNLAITIEGHSDERGTREYNLALADRRANSVMNYLVAYGIDPRSVRTISYGKERPAVGGSNSSSWAQNRRGVTIVE
jgi:peptidoglycan-associated lipoprotein